MAEEKNTPEREEEKAVVESQEQPTDGGQGAFAAILALREQNPPLFYGGLAALVVLVLLLFYMMTRGGEVEVKLPTVQVGQEATLLNPNIASGGSVLLTEAPGQILSEDIKEREKQIVCTVEGGTRAKVIEKQKLNYVDYVKVEPLSGECAGKQGWTSMVNVKP